MMSKFELSISFFFVNEEHPYETESIWPEIFTSSMAAISEKLTLIHLWHITKRTPHLAKTYSVFCKHLLIYDTLTSATPNKCNKCANNKTYMYVTIIIAMEHLMSLCSMHHALHTQQVAAEKMHIISHHNRNVHIRNNSQKVCQDYVPST